MTDDTGAGPVLDEVTAAVWTAREPTTAWCPDALLAPLEALHLDAPSREPATVATAQGPWQVRGASVRGKSHAHRGEFRDDALATFAGDDLLVLAVADGAGSSALSRVGAAVTAQLAVSRTADRFRAADASLPAVERLGTAMAHAVYDAAMQLHALAASAEVAPASLRTTLILVAIHHDLLLVSQVGDGAVLIQRRDGSVSRIGAVRETAWAGEVTCFVPDSCAMVQAAELRQLSAGDVALIALMTDGVDDPFHPLEQTGAALMAQWREGSTTSIGTARQPETGPVLGDDATLLRWLSFEQRGEVDDRTLLLAWRADGGAR